MRRSLRPLLIVIALIAFVTSCSTVPPAPATPVATSSGTMFSQPTTAPLGTHNLVVGQDLLLVVVQAPLRLGQGLLTAAQSLLTRYYLATGLAQLAVETLRAILVMLGRLQILGLLLPERQVPLSLLQPLSLGPPAPEYGFPAPWRPRATTAARQWAP